MTSQPQTLPLRFGIESLDELICPKQLPSTIEKKMGIWTAAIIGPDGCGKSILALHLASTYWNDNCVNDPLTCVIYASTDLSIEQAQGQWTNFGLDFPAWREEAVRAAYQHDDRRRPSRNTEDDTALKLDPRSPVSTGKDALYDFLTETRPPQESHPRVTHNHVNFFDLQSETAGDDWGFINHVVGLLPKRTREPRKHLLIIDAVEGLEAFVGDQDSFGQKRDRRSRVAQLIRRATAIGVHVVFVVEEPHADARVPEQFVTDLVIRVRHYTEHNYAQRTIEIEKCRAIPHVRGQHELSIRRGSGASTGKCSNLDDPHIYWKVTNNDKASLICQKEVSGKVEYSVLDKDYSSDANSVSFLSHVNVIHSLYYHNRKLRELRVAVPELIGWPSFGFQPLDRLLETSRIPGQRGYDGSLGILLGESGTHKGRLARLFLAQAFLRDRSLATAKEAGVAVLLSTRFIDQDTLVGKLRQHLKLSASDDRGQLLNGRVLCHRFGARHLTSGAFIDIIQRYISEAKFILGINNTVPTGNPGEPDRCRTEAWKVRIVLENWNSLLASYPNLQREPLLLPTVMSVIRRECVSALIVSTQPGQPGVIARDDAHELRNLDEPQVFTWAVPFYGDRRVAITAHSIGAPHRAPMICELESPKGHNEILGINRHFDLYADVDKGNPRRVPLAVRLYFGKHAAGEEEGQSGQFSRLLRNTFLQMFPGPADGESLKLERFTEYDALCTFADMLDDSHLDHTLVLQIDEFWAITNTKRGLFELTNYWNAPVSKMIHDRDDEGNFKREFQVEDCEECKDEDPLGLYAPHRQWYEPRQEDDPTPEISTRLDTFRTIQTTPSTTEGEAGGTLKQTDGKATLHRWSFFIADRDGGQPHGDPRGVVKTHPSLFRIPYLWDFGIILADRDLWNRYKHILIADKEPLGKLWNTLCRAKEPGRAEELGLKLVDERKDKSENNKCRFYDELPEGVKWRDFLAACRQIAALEDIPAFDVDLSTVETLSSLVFEMWASFEREAEPNLYDKNFESLTNRLFKEQHGLQQLLENCAGSLLQALVQLIYTCPQLRSRDRTVFREHVSPRCVASREWYSTSSAQMKRLPATRFVPLALPGAHSVRGDWHLAVAKGSRSELLATRAIDLLSSRRQNLLRLQDGLGLPVRDIVPDRHIGDMPTALVCYNETTERRITLSYRDVCCLGKLPDQEAFHWIWRSQITHYARDCFYWRRWLARMIEEQHRWFPPESRSELTVSTLMGSNLAKRWARYENGNRPRNEPLGLVFEGFKQRLQIIRSAVRDADSKHGKRT